MSWITTTSTSYGYEYISQPGWNAGARTVASFSADGGYQFKVGQATGIICGLNSVDESASYLEIDHGFFIEDARFKIIEGGSTKTGWFSYTKDHIFTILRFLDVVSYYVNDVLIYTSTNPSSGTVFLDCSLYSYLDSIIDACTIIDYSVDSGGIAQIDVSLLPIVAMGTTETESYALVDLLPLNANGTVTDVNLIDISVSPVIALGVNGDLNFADIEVSPLVVIAEEISLVPDYNSIAIELRALQTYGLQYDPDPSSIDVDLLPLVAIGDLDGDLHSLRVSVSPFEAELYLNSVNYLSTTWPAWQVVIRQLGQNIYGSLWLPALNLSSSAINKATISNLTLPELTLTAFSGARAKLSPSLTLSSAATNPGYATAELELAALSLSSSAISGDVAATSCQLPKLLLSSQTGAVVFTESLELELTASGTVVDIAQADLTLPVLGFVATAQVGVVGSASLTLPTLEFSSAGTVGGVGSAVLILPLLLLNANDDQVITESSYAVNLNTGAVTQLLLGTVDKLVTAHGKLYGLQGTQLVVLEGELDGAATIPATIRFAPQSFGSNRAKRMSDVYLSARENDGLTLTVIADEVASWQYQTATDTAPAYGTHKVNVGRGLKFHTAGLVIQNRNGGKMDIGGMELLVDTGTRRPKS